MAGDEYWPDDFQLHGITYLRYCVPRQIATPQPWPQVWMLGADGVREWQHENWQHQWGHGTKWPAEWWTVEQLERHFQRLALVGYAVQPIAAAGDRPPTFEMWLSQGPSWLLKGRRENRYLDRFTEEDHAGTCEVWLAADECASLTNEVQQLQLRWRELACFCQHAPLLQVESSPAEQLFWALYLLAESGEDEHWLLSRSKGKPGGLSANGHSGTGLSAACFQGLMAQAVHLRFQGDGAARRSWLHERAKEAELVEEFESLIRTWSLHDAAVGRAAHNVKLRADEASVGC